MISHVIETIPSAFSNAQTDLTGSELAEIEQRLGRSPLSIGFEIDVHRGTAGRACPAAC